MPPTADSIAGRQKHPPACGAPATSTNRCWGVGARNGTSFAYALPRERGLEHFVRRLQRRRRGARSEFSRSGHAGRCPHGAVPRYEVN